MNDDRSVRRKFGTVIRVITRERLDIRLHAAVRMMDRRIAIDDVLPEGDDPALKCRGDSHE